jgi:hypothetical protein
MDRQSWNPEISGFKGSADRVLLLSEAALLRLPSVGSFDKVRAKIVEIAADKKLIAAAKGRARSAAIRSRAFRPTTIGVLDFRLRASTESRAGTGTLRKKSRSI